MKRTVLISVNPGIPDDERPARRESDARWAKMLRSQGLVPFLHAWEAQPLFASQARADSVLLTKRRMHRVKHDPQELARSLEVMGLAEMPDYRGIVDDRCTLIVGEEDAKFVAIAASLPARRTITIPQCGHDPLIEQPAALRAVLDGELGA